MRIEKVPKEKFEPSIYVGGSCLGLSVFFYDSNNILLETRAPLPATDGKAMPGLHSDV